MANTGALRKRTLKDRLRDGEITIGPASVSSCPSVVEMIGYAGFDWVFIDTEQAAANIGLELEGLVRAAHVAEIPAIVRVPESGLSIINKTLNTGAQGIWVPHVESAEEAKLCVDAALYPPAGRRGAAPVIRAAEHAFYEWDTYMARANDVNLITLTIETVKGLENVEEIAAVPGVDSLCMGPFDMAVDMGLPSSAHYGDGEVSWVHEHLEDAARRTLKACHDNGLIPATLAWNADSLERWIDMGFRNLLFGTDVSLVHRALIDLKGQVDEIKGRSACRPDRRDRSRMIYDADADLAQLDGKTVAVLGYGSQGHAHALNLNDGGVDVVVGLRDGSASAQKASADGLRVASIADAAHEGDIVMVLLPDEKQGEIYATEIADGIVPGNLLMFAHGFAITYGQIDAGPGVDVGIVAPKSPGHLVRRQFVDGNGVPGLLAIHADETGNAAELVKAYAKGIGCTRAGVIKTTFKDETETDLFGEQAVLCGGVTELIRAGFDTLVDAGYDPRLAYFECLHEVKLIVDLIYEKGITGMRHSISNTAEYGDLTRGKDVITDDTRVAMRKILTDIQSGDFAREWIAENRAGQENFLRMREEGKRHQIEVEGRDLRSMMDWIDTEF